MEEFENKPFEKNYEENNIYHEFSILESSTINWNCIKEK